VTAPFVVGADGAARAVASEVEKLEARDGYSGSGPVSAARRAGLAARRFLRVAPQPIKVTRFVDDNVRIYKTVPFSLPSGAARPMATASEAEADAAENERQSRSAVDPRLGAAPGDAVAAADSLAAAAAVRAQWRCDVNYSARTADGRLNFDALPADAAGRYCGVLLLREGDPLAAEGSDPAELRAALAATLPQINALLDDATVAAVAAKPPSRLPSFRVVGPRLHHGATTCLLGDAVHTVDIHRH
jgi:hypothetical protein